MKSCLNVIRFFINLDPFLTLPLTKVKVIVYTYLASQFSF